MSERKNPFFEPYNTPHDTPPFDRIRIEDYEEAFMEGIRRDNEMIERIINNPAKPTFDNTIVDQENDSEDYYDLLERVSTVFFNLLSAETNDEMDALAQKLQPILTQHANDVRLNPKLFERVKYVHLHHRRLTPEEKMLLDNCYMGFVRSGALLDEEGKEKLRRLTEEASMLSLQFSQNVLKEHKAFRLHITDPAQLDGLPQTAIDAAEEEAAPSNLPQLGEATCGETSPSGGSQEGDSGAATSPSGGNQEGDSGAATSPSGGSQEGDSGAATSPSGGRQEGDSGAATSPSGGRQEGAGWTFTLDSPSYSPFMTYCKDRELRRQMYMAYNTQCIHDNDANNLEICKRLINLRREIAQLLGFKTYADYVLKHRMAGNVRNVYKLLNDLIDAYKPTAEKEMLNVKRLAFSDFSPETAKVKSLNSQQN